ncbi:glycosyltransferase family 8 protein [Babjeviella inositovora NRRL Y-12698]|uniref:Glycosyltransferase family 8 protein n=1 Tax=Babjeviella inositovora NRRL Y-12698 TaxID=984486 RepID=A0A1E3QSZ3_9ASCO|nr:glycosyltransferase family 8 protein [Babjeviella inositovora NRRL Y-12698]ODQ80790.1 glycosyltransferase family 8 protein [Babjeviella inositovora NRRL Y-12698]
MVFRSRLVARGCVMVSILLIAYQIFSHLQKPTRLSEYSLQSTGFPVSESNLKFIPAEVIQYVAKISPEPEWSKTAYFQYAAKADHLCAAIMNFIRLRDLRTKCPNLVILYEKNLDQRLEVKDGDDISKTIPRDQFRFQIELAQLYNIELRAIHMHRVKGKDSTYMASYTKFKVFAQTKYDRIVYFDADATIPKGAGHMDELFSLPDADIAIPQAYWLVLERLENEAKENPGNSSPAVKSREDRNDEIKILTESPHLYDSLPPIRHHAQFVFGSHFMVVKPNMKIYKALINAIWWKKAHEYDMDIINKVFNPSKLAARKLQYKTLVLPQQVYGGLTGEFRMDDHSVFMADAPDLPAAMVKGTKGYWTQWNAFGALDKLKLVHFSDFPYPKPWFHLHPKSENHQYRIECEELIKYVEGMDKIVHKPRIIEDCDAVEAWKGFYEEYADRMEVHCHMSTREQPSRYIND